MLSRSVPIPMALFGPVSGAVSDAVTTAEPADQERQMTTTAKNTTARKTTTRRKATRRKATPAPINRGAALAAVVARSSKGKRFFEFLKIRNPL